METTFARAGDDAGAELMSFWRRGAGDIAVVFVHGFLDDGHVWDRFATFDARVRGDGQPGTVGNRNDLHAPAPCDRPREPATPTWVLGPMIRGAAVEVPLAATLIGLDHAEHYAPRHLSRRARRAGARRAMLRPGSTTRPCACCRRLR
jgi:hypothetical protein